MIEMPVTATKTYNQIISDDPSIEAGLLYAGYPSTTVQSIRDWFGTRNVCDDDNFKNFFLRLANPLAPKYLAQLRMETIDNNFDPLVENYLERYTENGGNDTKKPAAMTLTENPVQYTKTFKPADYEVTESPAETTITEKPAETKTEHTPIGYTDTFTPLARYSKSGSIKRYDGKTEDTVKNDSDTKGVSKANPMTATSIGTSGTGTTGQISNGISSLGWSTASAQEQATTTGCTKTTHEQTAANAAIETYDSYSEGGQSGSDTTTREYASGAKETTEFKQGSKSGSRSLDVDTAGSKTVTYDSSLNKMGKEKYSMDVYGTKIQTFANDEKTTYGKTYKERYTGRAGLTPQQALTEAITYLRTISPAFFDLMMKLEPAFLGVYDL